MCKEWFQSPQLSFFKIAGWRSRCTFDAGQGHWGNPLSIYAKDRNVAYQQGCMHVDRFRVLLHQILAAIWYFSGSTWLSIALHGGLGMNIEPMKSPWKTGKVLGIKFSPWRSNQTKNVNPGFRAFAAVRRFLLKVMPNGFRHEVMIQRLAVRVDNGGCATGCWAVRVALRQATGEGKPFESDQHTCSLHGWFETSAHHSIS